MEPTEFALELPTISGAAKLAGVVGWPVAHSLSPRLHSLWLRRYGIDGAYVPLAVPSEDLGQVLAALPKLGFRGVNLTVPHKEAALALVDRLTADARLIGAVNTIVVEADGTLTGSNTDAFGFLANLRESVPGWAADRGPAVVLGAGGAARAVIHALREEGCPEIRLVNRTLSHAEAMAAEMGNSIRPVAWSDRESVLPGAALLVNTTTLGMRHQPGLELDQSSLPRDAVVYDIVYAPMETCLLGRARARGNPCVGGLGMLLHQARPGFAAWFGRMPEVDAALAGIVARGLPAE